MTPQTARYKHYDLGRQPAGTVVEVALSAINNVRLMDSANFKLYTRGQAYKFLGGLIIKTPTKLTIPASGSWHVVVDRDGLPKLAASNVRTIQPGHTHYRVQMDDQQTGEAQPGFGPAPANSDETAPAPPALAAEHSPEAMEEILKALDQYKRIANTDALTGLNNRRAFDEKLALLFADAAPLTSALIICDVDHFKAFNDSHGHLVGDRALAIVADVMRSHAPDGVFVARAGGEEFAMIIEARSRADIVAMAEDVRATLQATPFPDPATGRDYGPITMSMGICMMSDATDHLDMYAKADTALYASKNNGRNCCTIYAPGLNPRRPASPAHTATATG